MAKRMCPTCYGLGYVYRPQRPPGNLFVRVLHERCSGTGQVRAR